MLFRSEISRKIPRTETEMLEIRGMGPVLYQKYGVLLLETVQDWAAEHGHGRKQIQRAAACVMPERNKKPISHADTEASTEMAARPATPSMPNNGTPWSEEEDRQLQQETENKMMLLRIAAAHGRSATEIFERMRVLRLQ